MPKSNVILRLTPEGGPPPVPELQRVFYAAQENPAGVSWIATRKPGAEFVARPDSRLLAFARDEAGNTLLLTARVLTRRRALPPDALVRDMYENWQCEFGTYWKISEVRLKWITYNELPGTTTKGVRIPDAFRSPLPFAYWLPDPPADSDKLAHRFGPAPALPAVQSTSSRGLPLHGVDFSGAREIGGRNGKIWIASWYPDREFVELVSGGDDPGFNRRELADRVLGRGGIWVLDFPFGPPAVVAEAAGWATWRDYVAWCRTNPDPTVLRDKLRERLRRAGVRWPAKRAVDYALGTTWFPFFEQLYRQTITGARDVLYPVHEAGRDRTRILPFHDYAAADDRMSVVIEGFPGATLEHCGLPATGYKHPGGDTREQRRRIVHALRERGVPVCDADASRAIDDAEGDAVDALVLLHAAWKASHRSAAEWGDRVGAHASIEGWFFD